MPRGSLLLTSVDIRGPLATTTTWTYYPDDSIKGISVTRWSFLTCLRDMAREAAKEAYTCAVYADLGLEYKNTADV